MTIWKLEYLTPLSIGVAKMMNYQIDKQYLKELNGLWLSSSCVIIIKVQFVELWANKS